MSHSVINRTPIHLEMSGTLLSPTKQETFDCLQLPLIHGVILLKHFGESKQKRTPIHKTSAIEISYDKVQGKFV